jgi:hypothetical protein
LEVSSSFHSGALEDQLRDKQGNFEVYGIYELRQSAIAQGIRLSFMNLVVVQGAQFGIHIKGKIYHRNILIKQ